jgi:hypothetical protein
MVMIAIKIITILLTLVRSENLVERNINLPRKKLRTLIDGEIILDFFDNVGFLSRGLLSNSRIYKEFTATVKGKCNFLFEGAITKEQNTAPAEDISLDVFIPQPISVTQYGSENITNQQNILVNDDIYFLNINCEYKVKDISYSKKLDYDILILNNKFKFPQTNLTALQEKQYAEKDNPFTESWIKEIVKKGNYYEQFMGVMSRIPMSIEDRLKNSVIYNIYSLILYCDKEQFPMICDQNFAAFKEYTIFTLPLSSFCVELKNFNNWKKFLFYFNFLTYNVVTMTQNDYSNIYDIYSCYWDNLMPAQIQYGDKWDYESLNYYLANNFIQFTLSIFNSEAGDSKSFLISNKYIKLALDGIEKQSLIFLSSVIDFANLDNIKYFIQKIDKTKQFQEIPLQNTGKLTSISVNIAALKNEISKQGIEYIVVVYYSKFPLLSSKNTKYSNEMFSIQLSDTKKYKTLTSSISNLVSYSYINTDEQFTDCPSLILDEDYKWDLNSCIAQKISGSIKCSCSMSGFGKYTVSGDPSPSPSPPSPSPPSPDPPKPIIDHIPVQIKNLGSNVILFTDNVEIKFSYETSKMYENFPEYKITCKYTLTDTLNKVLLAGSQIFSKTVSYKQSYNETLQIKKQLNKPTYELPEYELVISCEYSCPMGDTHTVQLSPNIILYNQKIPDLNNDPVNDNKEKIANYTKFNQISQQEELTTTIQQIKQVEDSIALQKSILANQYITSTKCLEYDDKNKCLNGLHDSKKQIIDNLNSIINCNKIDGSIFSRGDADSMLILSSMALFYSTSNYETFSNSSFTETNKMQDCFVNQGNSILKKIADKYSGNRQKITNITNDYLNSISYVADNNVNIAKDNLYSGTKAKNNNSLIIDNSLLEVRNNILSTAALIIKNSDSLDKLELNSINLYSVKCKFLKFILFS